MKKLFFSSSVVKSKSVELTALLYTALKAARSNAPILITGESGTGKEVLARFIHDNSRRRNGSFVPVNCGAVPDNLLESEMFGYRKGAFSEAVADKPGLVLQAHNGTLFLDEIGEMPPSLQVKLLRFLQDHVIRPLGTVNAIKVDVRVLAATNLDIDEARKKGEFRQDLYYRLNVFRFTAPPLRKRKEDIKALSEFFIEKYNVENSVRVRGVSIEALRMMKRYNWPGNVRELENVIQRAVILTETGLIEPMHLPGEITGAPAMPISVRPELDKAGIAGKIERALILPPGARGTKRMLGCSVPLAQIITFFLETNGRQFRPRDFADYISTPDNKRRDKLTHQILTRLLDQGLLEHNGRQARAARYKLHPRYLVSDAPELEKTV